MDCSLHNMSSEGTQTQGDKDDIICLYVEINL